MRHAALQGGGAAHLQGLVRDVVVVLPHVRQDHQVGRRHRLAAHRVEQRLVPRLRREEQHPLQAAPKYACLTLKGSQPRKCYMQLVFKHIHFQRFHLCFQAYTLSAISSMSEYSLLKVDS